MRKTLASMLLIGLAATLPGCGDNQSSAPSAPRINAKISVFGEGIPSQARVTVTEGVNPVWNAKVTVNGTTLLYDSIQQVYQQPVAVNEGSTFGLSVEAGGVSYAAASCTQYTAPTIISAGIWLGNIDNVLTWAEGVPSTGIKYSLSIVDMAAKRVTYPAGANSILIPEGTTSWKIPAGTLLPGTYGIVLGVQTDGDGVPVPGAAPGSGIQMESLASGSIIVQ